VCEAVVDPLGVEAQDDEPGDRHCARQDPGRERPHAELLGQVALAVTLRVAAEEHG
jgi:hypothetical protein